jgi:hypothetical protein
VRRFHRGLACLTTMFCAGSIFIGVQAAGATAGVTNNSVEACPGTLSGSTYTLSGDCNTTIQLTVPDGVTLNGAGHTIMAHDPGPGLPFSGSVVTNDPTGHTMNIENLTIQGTGFAVDCSAGTLIGIFFDDASGSITNVNVKDITQHDGCPLGYGIRANALAGVARTVTITKTVVSGYQKSGLIASGMMTLDMSDSTIGPPDRSNPALLPAQNGVQYGGSGTKAGAGGTISDSVLYGSGFGNASNQGIAVLLFDAKGVTLSDDTVTGAGTDYGIDATSNSTGVVITHDAIGRTAPDVPDTFGVGVIVAPDSTATVTCNTFSGWITDTVGVAAQPLCITTTGLPPGDVGVPYDLQLTAVGGTAPYTWSVASGTLPPGLTLSPTGKLSGTPTESGTFNFTIKVTDSIGAAVDEPFSEVIEGSPGYWLGASDGGVFTFGQAGFLGSMGGKPLNAPVVGMASTPTGGYLLVSADGGVFCFGAPFLGSLGGQHLDTTIVGMAATPDGGGYFLVGADGEVFPFGDAVLRGSLQGTHLNKPIVGIAVTRDNKGYYLVASDGGVFTFGDAAFLGSMGGKPLNAPVVGMALDTAGTGYWLVASDGGVFSFGAPFFGSMGGKHLNAPVVAMASDLTGTGYWFAASDGGVFSFGAPFFGSMGGKHLNAPVVAIASTG